MVGESKRAGGRTEEASILTGVVARTSVHPHIHAYDQLRLLSETVAARRSTSVRVTT